MKKNTVKRVRPVGYKLTKVQAKRLRAGSGSYMNIGNTASSNYDATSATNDARFTPGSPSNMEWDGENGH